MIVHVEDLQHYVFLPDGTSIDDLLPPGVADECEAIVAEGMVELGIAQDIFEIDDPDTLLGMHAVPDHLVDLPDPAKVELWSDLLTTQAVRRQTTRH